MSGMKESNLRRRVPSSAYCRYTKPCGVTDGIRTHPDGFTNRSAVHYTTVTIHVEEPVRWDGVEPSGTKGLRVYNPLPPPTGLPTHSANTTKTLAEKLRCVKGGEEGAEAPLCSGIPTLTTNPHPGTRVGVEGMDRNLFAPPTVLVHLLHFPSEINIRTKSRFDTVTIIC